MVLIGTENSKRTNYMKKAAMEENIPLRLLTWDSCQPVAKKEKALENTPQKKELIKSLCGTAVKIDPPPPHSFDLKQMNETLAFYKASLSELAEAECVFLNTPETVCCLLDKRTAKKILQENGVPVTEMFPETVKCTEQLLELMERRRCFSVFVKPRYFSGAAGVAAFRFHPSKGRFCLYTSCRLEGDKLINTKKLFRREDRQEIFPLLDRLLALDCVVERWHPKAAFDGKSYDLRIVYQFGHIACTVARQSDGPITNLHLNNRALAVQSLHLPPETTEEIKNICARAYSLFDGISMAGVDILLERESLRPRIIEINGQGDLIYQDIFGDNRIYREQVRWLHGQEALLKLETDTSERQGIYG